MAYSTNELYSEVTQGAKKRIFATSIQPKTFAAGSGTIAAGTPVYYDTGTGTWKPLDDAAFTADDAVATITAAATVATDGTFDLFIKIGDAALVTVADLAHDIATSALDTAISNALTAAGYTVAAGDIVVAEGGGGLDANNGTCTVTFGGQFANMSGIFVTGDFSDLTGDPHTVAMTTLGQPGAFVDGVLWPDAVTLDSDEEVLGQVMLAGRVHIDDIEVPSTMSASQVRSAFADRDGHTPNIIVEGLAGSR